LKTRFMWVDDVIVDRDARVPHNRSPFLKGDLSEFEFEFKSLNVSEAQQGDTGDRDKRRCSGPRPQWYHLCMCVCVCGSKEDGRVNN
jgi:hypothetical protein